MAVVRWPGCTDAELVKLAVNISLDVAWWVAAARAVEPDSCPTIPRTGVVEWLTRKTLADLLEIGYEPDGWQKAFSEPMPFEPGYAETDKVPVLSVRLPDEGFTGISARYTDNGYEVEVRSEMDLDNAIRVLETALQQVRMYGLTQDDE